VLAPLLLALAVVYVPPVDAPVVDPFRAPPSPFGAGNRGLEYATDPGQVVSAIGDGEVVFAGPVGGRLHVTVLHPDGLRSSYSYLAQVVVNRGDRVGQGEAVGYAGRRFHLGVRSGDVYLDPATLFAMAAPAVRLIPVDGPLTPSAGLAAAAASGERLVRAVGSWVVGGG